MEEEEEEGVEEERKNEMKADMKKKEHVTLRGEQGKGGGTKGKGDKCVGGSGR